jgi:hypothetical protein
MDSWSGPAAGRGAGPGPAGRRRAGFAKRNHYHQWQAAAAAADTGTPVDDKDYQVPFKFTGKIKQITLTIDRPQLSPEDIMKLEAAQREKKMSE